MDVGWCIVVQQPQQVPDQQVLDEDDVQAVSPAVCPVCHIEFNSMANLERHQLQEQHVIVKTEQPDVTSSIPQDGAADAAQKQAKQGAVKVPHVIKAVSPQKRVQQPEREKSQLNLPDDDDDSKVWFHFRFSFELFLCVFLDYYVC